MNVKDVFWLPTYRLKTATLTEGFHHGQRKNLNLGGAIGFVQGLNYPF